jgi:predicted dithiol-disulfide oxidoreductase (DUF899 family)
MKTKKSAMSRKLTKRISTLEKALLKKQAELVKLTKKLHGEVVEDYKLYGPGNKSVKLSQLFGDKEDLIVIHNMGTGCSYCTMWADGFNGLVPHLEDRAALVLVSPDAPKVQAAFARQRNWKFKMYSSEGSAFAKDMGFSIEKNGENHALPGVSTFHKTSTGKILRIAKAWFGPGDAFCSVWHFFDLLARGANGWEPKYKY